VRGLAMVEMLEENSQNEKCRNLTKL
jgi:hypothetical protein